MTKKVLIIGITGQDGSFAAKIFNDRGFQVYGIARDVSFDACFRLRFLKLFSIIENVFSTDINDLSSFKSIIKKIKPTHIINLSGQTKVTSSFNNPSLTFQTNFISVVNILNLLAEIAPDVVFFQALSSEIYGCPTSKNFIVNEESPKNPITPYGISKLALYNYIQYLREEKGIKIFSGIFFNHESELRGDDFLSKYLVKNIVNYKNNKIKSFDIGSFDIYRDWGYAEDYMKALYNIVDSNYPTDYIVSTNKITSIKTLIEITFDYMNIDFSFVDNDLNSFYLDKKTNKPILLLRDSPRKFAVEKIGGNNHKLTTGLMWSPKTCLKRIIQLMVDYESSNH